MDEHLHIIIAGDRGKVIKVPCSRKKLCIIITTSIVALLILTVTSICSFSLYTKNRNITNQIAGLQEKLQDSAALIAKHTKKTEEERRKIDRKMAHLEQKTARQETVAALQEEKESLLTAAVDELNEKSQLIEKIFGNIGIKLPKEKDSNPRHSGGPFIQPPELKRDELLFKADKYLKVIRYLPLGRPVPGPITSGFGKRKDPFNRRAAYHTGIDFRGDKGEKIYATADGVVVNAFHNGGYGKYVLIDHGNGYQSAFAHMQKYLVHKGDRVKRGQPIGMVGNTGRSTGSHLHYEIQHEGVAINPYKYLKVANFAKLSPPVSEKR